MTVKDSITMMDALSNFYTVPEFQRNYSWTENDDIQQLWKDIVRVKEKKIENYFFGPVLLRDTQDPKTFRIIDGQQRFATVSIFLAVISDKLWTLGDKEFARDYQKFIQGALPGTPLRFRITRNKTDRD